jgi:hypothetical protein
MKFAYADPPYLNCCSLYDHYHPDGRCWDDLETHRLLIERLNRDYPDGWALSLTSVSLQAILPLVPADHRICAWTKPFAAYKRNVRNAYTWEPVIVVGGRKSSKDGATPTRDHLEEPPALAEPITMKKGLTGAKPKRLCNAVIDWLGWKLGDTIDDLYPGTGIFSLVLAVREGQALAEGNQPAFDFGEVS